MNAEKAKLGSHLLESIRATRESVGEGLNDDEFTRLVRCPSPPTEAGFTLISFCDGVATFSVPEQDFATWYPKEGWITPEKDSVGRMIAEKYGLTLGEPPDEPPSCRFPSAEPVITHHHLEFIAHRTTLIVAHPKYLKVRLFGAAAERGYLRISKVPQLGPELLEDLSALYRA